MVKEVLLVLLFGIHVPKVNMIPNSVLEFHLRLVWTTIFGEFLPESGFNI